MSLAFWTLQGSASTAMIHSLAPPPIGPTNVELADVLGQMADLLVRRGEPNPYRVQAYLQAAAMLRDLDTPAVELYGEGGRDALTELPGVGVSLAAHLADYIERGRVGLRDRLLASDDPAALAARLVQAGIRTLADLERAAHDGRLAEIAGFGPRRLEAARLQLNSILNRSARRRERRVRRQVARLAAIRQRREAERDAETESVPTSDDVTVATIYPLFPPAAA